MLAQAAHPHVPRRGQAGRHQSVQYTQVNIREQDSWAHTDDPGGATHKAISLVKAGIARTRLSEPLEPLVVETTQKTLVIGGGIAGLRAAIGLADVGLEVFLVEREQELGGWVGRFGNMYPHERKGRELIASLVAEVRKRSSITVFTNAELMAKSGSFGNYVAAIRINRDLPELIHVEVGSIVVATGFDTYQPEAGEFGYGIDGVVTLPEFKALVDGSSGPLSYHGRPVRTIAYVYCVGSRQAGRQRVLLPVLLCRHRPRLARGGRRWTSQVHQYHLYRDIRTYGKYELMYTESRKRGSVYMKFPEDTPPSVARNDGRPADGHHPRHADRRRGAHHPGRPGGAGDGHGPSEERGADEPPQAAGGYRRVLQRDPPQAAPGRDRGRRRADRGLLPGAQELRRERRVGTGGGHPERGRS